MKKLLITLSILIVIIIIGLIAFVNLTWNRDFEAEFPDIRATNDSAMIERGRYLVFGPGHCASCHIPMDKIASVENGAEIPLVGGWELSIPLGTFRAPNLTPDKETGIGNISDESIARALRYSVGHKNNLVLNFMPFQEMSDYDISAVLSFLRTQPSVKNKVPDTEYTFLGKFLLSFGLLTPQGPINEPPKEVVIDNSVEYGKYLAHSVANCYGCHTERDMKSGEFIGKPFAGGMYFPPDENHTKGYAFISPNITPNHETSVMNNWTLNTFIQRFRMGRVHEGSTMPWGAFERMSDADLEALYNYLVTVEPVDNSVYKIVFAPGDELPN